jgi:hypothetical protein
MVLPGTGRTPRVLLITLFIFDLPISSNKINPGLCPKKSAAFYTLGLYPTDCVALSIT